MKPILDPSPLFRHGTVAFQFSGGKDSTAALFALRPYWARMTVYWIDTSDNFPEVRSFVGGVARLLPCFRAVKSNVHAVIDRFGIPADIIPEANSAISAAMNCGRGPLLQERVLCCARAKMNPMHERMKADGVTLIVRGQKACDEFKGPLSSGGVADDLEVYYPIENWTDEDVTAYLDEIDVNPPLYQYGLTRSGDCMSCSAWLGDARGEYLRKQHPQAFHVYRDRVFTISRAVQGDVGRLMNAAVAAGGA